MSRALVGLVAALLTTTLAVAQSIQIYQGGPPGSGDLSAPPFGQQPPARDNLTKTGTATIRGRVFAADNGQPLRKAQVRIASPDVRENRLATTDADGQYEVKELPAGRYNVTASKGSYVSLSFGQLRPFEPGKPLDVRDGQTIEKVNFALPHGSVITGHVLDDYGDPASDVMVQVMRYQYVQGQRRLIPAGRATMTDDIGGFRLFGLSPGQYYLSATLRSVNGPGPTGPLGGLGPIGGLVGNSDDRSGYAATYYPGTSNVAVAERLTLDVGQTLSDLTMTLVPVRLSRVSGTAVDSAGRPFSGAMIMVAQSQGFGGMVAPGNQVRADGAFTLNGLAPGEYTLQVFRPPIPLPAPGSASASSTAAAPFDSSESASATLSVNGSDIDDVRLVGTKPSTISGKILASGSAAQSVRPSTMAVQVLPVLLGPMIGPPARAAVRDDLSFETQARPGKARVNVAPLPAGVTVKAIRYNGVDVTDAGLDIRPNEDIGGLSIELTDQITTVTGLVTSTGSAPVKDYSLVVFGADADRWSFPRYQRVARPDQDGRFKITGLPAGRYYAIALDYVDQVEANDPEVLDRLRLNATSFSLGEGETKQLDLRLSSIP